MLPDFIIIGTMKGGTTSLHHYLRLHPDIFMSWQKELNFFIESRNWHKGLAWYEAQFDGSGRVRGEASPNYSAEPDFPGVSDRMHSVVPNAKLIYTLRDPIERMLSHYVHNVSDGRETRPADAAFLEEGSNAYVSRSRYYEQLRYFLRFYDREQILLLTREDLWHRRRDTLRRIFRFVGVDESFWSPRYQFTRHHSRDKRLRNPVGRVLFKVPYQLGIEKVSREMAWHLAYGLSFPFSRSIPRPVLDEGVRIQLVARLRDDLAALRAFTGMAFDEWSF